MKVIIVAITSGKLREFFFSYYVATL